MYLQLANGQDYATVNVKFVSSLVNVSSIQYQKTFNYISQYTTATSRLAQASSYLYVTLQNVVNITNVQGFISHVQDHLNENVQKLTLRYSPTNVQNFIVGYYQAFLANLSNNNGTQSEIAAMNLLYARNFLKSGASACMTKYNANRFEVYSEAASEFTKLMEQTTSETSEKVDDFRKEISTMVSSIVKSVEKIIANRETASVEFDNFVRISESRKLRRKCFKL